MHEETSDAATPDPTINGNGFRVESQGINQVAIGLWGKTIGMDEAINLSAWLAAVADPGGKKFKARVRAIQEGT